MARAETVDASSGPSLGELAHLAVDVLGAIPFPALVLQVPSGRIAAASPAATCLLDPAEGAVIGHLLEEFTTDLPLTGHDLYGGARLDGVETIRVVRRTDGSDLKIRMWIRSFDREPPSSAVMAVIIAEEPVEVPDDQAADTDQPDTTAVIGVADGGLLIERISSDAEALFHQPVTDLLHTSLLGLVAAHDVDRCRSALGTSSATQNGVTLHLYIRTGTRQPETRCELLILPLQPPPGCVFVFMPISGHPVGEHDLTSLSTTLTRLRRSAEIAHLTQIAFSGRAHAVPDGFNQLTTREIEIVTRLLDGQRPPAIARALFLSQSTIRNHLGSVYAKLGVASQQQLVDLLRAA